MTEGHTDRLSAALAGRYRIERKLGEGGMASVYLAEDLKHARKVALKILRPELAAVIGAERFLSEIRTTANLQHPHILPLFDSGEAGGYLYYVMPYIDGETLRDKLDREKQLGVEEAARIARDVADALDYAHRHGVIHRDIKPANILLHDGRPVVADFGIALAVSAAGGGRMTETGMSLGTPHYMSPEQASADRDLTARSDIYSLGCVLYEMIAGQPPHTGPSAQSVLVHILTKDVTPLAELRHTVPAHVAAAVAMAIEKLPADRFESVKAFRDALGNPAFRYETSSPMPPGARAPVGLSGRRDVRSWLRDGRSVAALAAVWVLAGIAAWGWQRPAPTLQERAATRLTMWLPSDAPLSLQLRYRDLAVSHDGRTVIYKGSSPEGAESMYVRRLGETVVSPLEGAEKGVHPVISPSGAWVAFIENEASANYTVLRRVSILGGVPVTVVEIDMAIASMGWLGDDALVYGTVGSGLFRIAASGGAPELLTTLDAARNEAAHRAPHFIEEGNAIAFWIATSDRPAADGGELAVLDLASARVTRLGLFGVNPRYIPTGHLVYGSSDGSIRGVPFDVRSLEVIGSEVPLVEDVYFKATGTSDFDVSGDGTLVYASGSEGTNALRSLVWVSRDGTEEMIAAEPRAYSNPRISPNGRRLAVGRATENPQAPEIWIWDFERGTPLRMSLGLRGYSYPTWSPDGARIAYGTTAGELAWAASDGAGTPQVLTGPLTDPGALRAPSPYFFTHDGRALVFRDQANPATNDDVLMISLESDSIVWRLPDVGIERNAALSPDGRWVAYEAGPLNRFEVYVRPFPDVHSDVISVSSNGGRYPLFSRDGRELLYVEPGTPERLISVDVESSFDRRTVVMPWPYYASEGRPFDVAPDGRFIALKLPGEAGGGATTSEIQVVLNWFEEVRQRMGNP